MTIADSSRAGLVLAGGRSTRFGDQDKVLADVNGVPMIARTVARVTQVVDGIVVSCRSDQMSVLEAILSDWRSHTCLVPDPTPDRGPVAGIAAGIRAIDTPYVAVVAADNPLVDPNFLEYLFARAENEEGAVPELDGWRKPTQAVYRTEALETACNAVIDTDDTSLMAVLDVLNPLVVPERTVLRRTSRDSFMDINTTEDLEHAADRIDR